jgi:hypothetical protein
LDYIKLHKIMKKYFAMKCNQSHRHKCRIDIDVKNVCLNVWHDKRSCQQRKIKLTNSPHARRLRSKVGPAKKWWGRCDESQAPGWAYDDVWGHVRVERMGARMADDHPTLDGEAHQSEKGNHAWNKVEKFIFSGVRTFLPNYWYPCSLCARVAKVEILSLK